VERKRSEHAANDFLRQYISIQLAGDIILSSDPVTAISIERTHEQSLNIPTSKVIH
jgi:hypothetical protein